MDDREEKIINQARRVVETIVLQRGVQDPKQLRLALYQTYPFGKRTGYRYQALLKVIKEQAGGMRPPKPDPRQLNLFQIEDSKECVILRSSSAA